MKIQNTSGQSFVFSEIKRKVTPEPRKIHIFSEEEIEKDGFLRNLIKKGIFVEVDYEDVPEEKIKEKEFEKVKNLFDDNQIAVEVGGKKEDDIERFGRDPNKTVCVEPNKLLSRGNSQIIEERIAKKEFIEPIMNYGERSVFEFGNTNEDFFIDSEPVQNLSKKSKSVKKKQTELWFNSPANDSSGYGKFGRECVKGLHRRGVNVHLDLFKIPDFRSSVPLTPEIEEMMENEVSLKAPSVWAIMPPKYLHRAGRKVLYTMMETNSVPPRFAEKCNLADELWLPSLHNMQIFEEVKIKPELFHMPLGVNTDLYKPMIVTEGQKSLFDIKTKGFVFMSLFGWSLRKGTDAMLKAYLQTFTKDDDVTLLIVSRKDGMTAKNKNDEIRKEITKYIKRWSPEKHPHIVHIGDNIAEEKLPILYNMSDCFLTLSRGEGYGLPYMEAGSCEKPVIATRCGGQLDFLTDKNSYLVDIEGYDIANQEMQQNSSYYENQPFAVLGETTVNQTKEIMHSIYKDKKEAQEKGKTLRRDLVNAFTWDHFSDRIYERVLKIQG